MVGAGAWLCDLIFVGPSRVLEDWGGWKLLAVAGSTWSAADVIAHKAPFQTVGFSRQSV